jgi:hypothetical protein
MVQHPFRREPRQLGLLLVQTGLHGWCAGSWRRRCFVLLPGNHAGPARVPNPRYTFRLGPNTGSNKNVWVAIAEMNRQFTSKANCQSARWLVKSRDPLIQLTSADFSGEPFWASAAQGGTSPNRTGTGSVNRADLTCRSAPTRGQR